MRDPKAPILLVEDDEDVRASLQDILEDSGYAVACAGDGAEALRQLTAVRPSVILLDLMMPGLDGAAFLAHRETDPALRDLPVFIMSASRAPARGLEGFTVAGYLDKPMEMDRLLQAVRPYCTPV